MDTVESLCKRYQVDLAHAQHVSTLALGLFDALQPIHQQPPRMRALLEAGALLHNVGLSVDEPNHHHAGRDIIVASSLQGFDPAERVMLACMVAFHRKNVQPSSEPLFNALSSPQQHQTLVLSALVRVADGLDCSLSQTTEIDEIRDSRLESEAQTQLESPISSRQSPLNIRVRGPHSHEDAARAMKKADLWNMLFPPLHITARMTRPGIMPDDPLAQSGRRILRYQVELLSPEEWRPNGGVTAEGIHELRVATRRLRTILRVFKPYYSDKAVQPISKGLRDLARVLFDARELDVSVRALKLFHQAANDETRQGLQPLLDAWKAQRKTAREEVQRYLEGERYLAWLDALERFVKTDTHDRPPQVGEPYYLRHVVDKVMAGHLAAVRVYDTLPVLPPVADLHAARIAVKRLRYVTDAFREVLPPERAEQILSACAAARDEYGVLHDAHLVAGRALNFFADLRSGVAGVNENDPVIARGVLAFAGAQQHIVEERMGNWRQCLVPLLVL
jgi:CHAD domain-containing protein